MDLFDHPYASFLTSVLKPNRYTGREHNVVCKPWDSVEARFCLAFPDVYDIGMSHLGYRILYKILNDDPRTLAERCYMPWTDMAAELEKRGLPLCSLENVRPLAEFDVVGFSLQYELTYSNILYMLDKGGIALRAADRDDAAPLVVAGGPVATHPEPMALFFDAILVGDGEEAAKEIALLWVAGKRAGLSRYERLVQLSQLTGVYVPSLYEAAPDPDGGFWVVQPPKDARVPFPIERRLVPNLDAYPFPDDFPVGGPEAIFDRMSIEVARGCTEGCRFCQAGMIYRPVRERDPEQVIDTVLRALEKSGQDEVSLTALSTADVSCISPLIKRLVEKTAPERVSLSVASLRAYGLAEDLLDDMRKVRASGLTFAPEAGTQRMRDVINKNVTEAQLMETAERIFTRGFDRMKLYFILGLPTEEDEDVIGIAEVGKNAFLVGKRVGKRPAVTVSVSVHVPKPHTPFQWAKMDDLGEVERKQELLKFNLRGWKGVTLKLHDSTTSELEGILARGDRRLADVIERAYRGGAVFDSWDEHFKRELWGEALTHFGIDTSQFLSTIPLSARLPWDHIDVGLEDGFLAREYRKALQSRLSPPCGKARGMFIHHTNVAQAEADQRKLVCYDCGIACDMGLMKEGRVDFLRQMGALEPGQPVRLPVLQLESGAALRALEANEPKAPPTQPKKKSPEHYRPARPGSAPVRFRLRYQKTGPTALLGHLDFIKELPRVIRRAGVRTAYTEGFHPRADITFSPALTLGVASIDEYMDISLIDAPPVEQLAERLNRASSGGLSFTNARALDATDTGLAKIIDEARYVVAFGADSFESEGGAAGLAVRLGAFLALEEKIVWRDTKGIKRKIDARAPVLALSLGGDQADRKLRQAGIVGRLLSFEVALRIDPSGTVRLLELVEAITAQVGFPYVAVRSALLGQGSSPLELDLHKKVERPRSLALPVNAVLAGGAAPSSEVAPLLS